MTASSDNNLVVLPRPGATDVSTDFEPPIAAPLEADFTAAFGALLPAAQYITTPRGRFAYYDLPPSSSSSSSSAPAAPARAPHPRHLDPGPRPTPAGHPPPLRLSRHALPRL
ncbi:hypothetical protein MN608_11328 [Microdochium nivale]|nr:hypothetical protein MN608_11328 [Microdochium nivale]